VGWRERRTGAVPGCQAQRQMRTASVVQRRNQTPIIVAIYTYHSRGQLTAHVGRGANIEYRYSTTANDGRLTSRKDNIFGEEVSYQYDELGRLIAAATTDTSWGLVDV